jgi:flagellar hook-basal body complex protein FliE
MSINSMADIINQIEFQARQVSGLNNSDAADSANTADAGVSFSDLLSSSLYSLNQVQNSAKNQAEDYMSGAPDIGLNDVMLSLQKSTLALNLGIQVRNKMVSAYQEIMGMPV